MLCQHRAVAAVHSWTPFDVHLHQYPSAHDFLSVQIISILRSSVTRVVICVGFVTTLSHCNALLRDCLKGQIAQGGCLITISSQGSPGQAGSSQSSFISSSSRGSPGEPGSSKYSSYTSSSPGSPGKPGSSYSGTLTRKQVKVCVLRPHAVLVLQVGEMWLCVAARCDVLYSRLIEITAHTFGNKSETTVCTSCDPCRLLQMQDISDNIGDKYDNNVNELVMDVLDL